MKPVLPHVKLANRLIISNVWLLEDGAGRRFVVDTGHFLERYTLKRALWQAGVRGPGDLTAVLLTHRHSDHAGNAAWLRRTFGCPVICHAQDAAVLSGAAPLPRLARGLGRLHEEVLCHIEDRLPARSVVDEVYEDGRWKWGFLVAHAPGHTEGTVLLHHEGTRTLFSGDAILAGPAPQRFFERPSLAMPGFSLDVDRCHQSVRRFLKELPPTDSLCAGHGPAILDRTQEKLRRLL